MQGYVIRGTIASPSSGITLGILFNSELRGRLMRRHPASRNIPVRRHTLGLW